jgi:uncharacterized protein
MNVALYGATAKPDRYAYMAFSLLREHGHTVFPIHPRLQAVDGVGVYRDLASIEEPLDTLTLYIGPARQAEVMDDIINAPLKRVVFNPGTENPELKARLEAKGVQTLEACTLVMLKTAMWDG